MASFCTQASSTDHEHYFTQTWMRGVISLLDANDVFADMFYSFVSHSYAYLSLEIELYAALMNMQISKTSENHAI